MVVLGFVLSLVGVWFLDYLGNSMSISEYEFFGVSSHANAKNTRYTNSKGNATAEEPAEKEVEENEEIKPDSLKFTLDNDR